MQNGGISNNSKQVLMIKISIHFYFRVNINRCNPCAREVQSPRKRHSLTSSFYDTIIQKIRQMGDTVSRSTRENYLTALRSLCRFAGIDGRLTSYTARHSWATTAYHSNVDLPVISKALGHSNPQTTLTYLREVDDHRLVEANRRIAHSI